LSQVLDDYSIDVWVYGHTHSNLDLTVKNTRIISNQAGYPSEGVKCFDSSFCISL
ncbi:hypothetical protein MNBD_GAMMA10-2202, partial [hydrothermal vent metagenome]